jgi:hypothetical protein
MPHELPYVNLLTGNLSSKGGFGNNGVFNPDEEEIKSIGGHRKSQQNTGRGGHFCNPTFILLYQ